MNSTDDEYFTPRVANNWQLRSKIEGRLAYPELRPLYSSDKMGFTSLDGDYHPLDDLDSRRIGVTIIHSPSYFSDVHRISFLRQFKIVAAAYFVPHRYAFLGLCDQFEIAEKYSFVYYKWPVYMPRFNVLHDRANKKVVSAEIEHWENDL